MAIWSKVQFKELFLQDSRNGIYKESQFHGKGTKVVGMGQIFKYGVISNQEMDRYDISDDEMDKFSLMDGDLVFARRSLVDAGAGKSSIIINPSEPMVFESSVIRIRLDRTKCSPLFYYYWFKSFSGKSAIRAIVSGTSVKGIRSSDLSNIIIDCPSLDIQNCIASILYRYDLLIEVNNKINDYLFEVCKLLFNEARKKSTEYSALTTFAEVCYGKDHKNLSEGTIPVFGSGGVMRYVDRALYQGNESVLVPRKGSLNNILYVSEPFWSVDTMFYTKIKKKHGGKYLYFYLLSIDMEFMNAGSAVPSMTTEILDKMIIPNPGDDILEQFDTAVQPFFDMIKNNKKVNNKLESCRQTLIKQMFDK